MIKIIFWLRHHCIWQAELWIPLYHDNENNPSFHAQLKVHGSVLIFHLYAFLSSRHIPLDL
jgi:hypothetical protein